MPPYRQFKDDKGGTFTDSANYIYNIPECTNISIGYFDQHSNEETFDLFWLENIFLPAIVQVEWAKLPATRVVTKKPIRPAYSGQSYRRHDPDDWNIYYGGGGSYRQHENKQKQWSIFSADRITKYTPLYNCPDWNVDDGILAEANEEGMRRIIEGYVAETDKKEVATEILSLLHTVESLKALVNSTTWNTITDVEALMEEVEEGNVKILLEAAKKFRLEASK